MPLRAPLARPLRGGRTIAARRSRAPRWYGKPTNDGYRCKLCCAWIEYRDLGKVLAHEGRCRTLPKRREKL